MSKEVFPVQTFVRIWTPKEEETSSSNQPEEQEKEKAAEEKNHIYNFSPEAPTKLQFSNTVGKNESLTFDGINVSSNSNDNNNNSENNDNNSEFSRAILSQRMKQASEGRNIIFLSYGGVQSGKTSMLFGSGGISSSTSASSASSRVYRRNSSGGKTSSGKVSPSHSRRNSLALVKSDSKNSPPSTPTTTEQTEESKNNDDNTNEEQKEATTESSTSSLLDPSFSENSLCSTIFNYLLQIKQQFNGSTISVGMVEIHGERCFDLLDLHPQHQNQNNQNNQQYPFELDPAKTFHEKRVKLQTDGAAQVENLFLKEVVDFDSFKKIVSKPIHYRKNSPSSVHSHFVFQFHLARKVPGMIFKSTISLVDLSRHSATTTGSSSSSTAQSSSAFAGASSPLVTSASTAGIASPALPPLSLETSSPSISSPAGFSSSQQQALSQSSVTLKKCFDQLIEAAKQKRPPIQVPYRQSVLTSLLSDIFGGTALLSIIGSATNFNLNSTTSSSSSRTPSSSEKINKEEEGGESSSTTITTPPQTQNLPSSSNNTNQQQILLQQMQQQQALRFCSQMRHVSLMAKINSERALNAAKEMKAEVEELKKKLEVEKQSREAEIDARSEEVADMEQRRRRLEQEQKAKKSMNAKALASISKQMKTLQNLQSQLSERETLLSAASQAKEQKRSLEASSFRVQQQNVRERDVGQMREQEAILQRQIALQLEAQQAVQQKMRDDADKNRHDLSEREMSFVFRTAAERTRSEAETRALELQVEELRMNLDDAKQELQCRRTKSAALQGHIHTLQEEHDYLHERYILMDTLLNDGIESRAKDIRECEHYLEDTEDRLKQLVTNREETLQECASLQFETVDDMEQEEETLLHLREERDEKRQILMQLQEENDLLLQKRSLAEDAAVRAKKAGEFAGGQVRDSELLNARRCQEESILGEQLADVLRSIASSRKRSHQLDGMLNVVQVQLQDVGLEKEKFEASREAFETFFETHNQNINNSNNNNNNNININNFNRQDSNFNTPRGNTPRENFERVSTKGQTSVNDTNNNKSSSVSVSALSRSNTNTNFVDRPTLVTTPQRLSRQSTPVMTDAQKRALKRVSLARKN